MIVYLSAPYSSQPDKDELFRTVMTVAGQYMIDHPESTVVSPLFCHPITKLVPNMGTDYNFWGAYSRDLLRRCDKVLLLTIAGWDNSIGVADELRYATELNLPIEEMQPPENQ